MGLEQPDMPPLSRAECARLGWKEIDILIVTGDALVDHPAFGAALLARWLIAHGYRTGIVAQPRWTDTGDIAALGRPRLFAGVTAGALDSMLAHYTAFRKKRRDDAYTPGGRSGARPNRATIVYAGLVRQAFPGLPVVVGGIEASLRRATHYDFWSDSFRRSILLDSKADWLVCGMAERALLDLARAMEAGGPVAPSTLRGVAWAESKPCPPPGDFADAETLPSHEDIAADPRRLMAATLAFERQTHNGGPWLAQSSGGRRVWFAPPAAPLAPAELDALYALPFSRRAHPRYAEPVPALETVQFSITAHRGCAGGCTFCSLALHQGRRIQSRGAESIAAEAGRMTRHPDWRGSVTDVGGPSANMWGARCLREGHPCRRASCLTPAICPHFACDQHAAAHLLDTLARIPGVRHVRVASGIRHDLALRDPDYLQALTARHTGGQLKLAPEHCRENVLRLMRKPPFDRFERFMEIFQNLSRESGKEQYIVPYLMSAFPGCTDEDMRALARWLESKGWKPRQVQCFIPTPGTVATAMYCAGIAPDGRPIPVARTDAERLRQHRILVCRRDA